MDKTLEELLENRKSLSDELLDIVKEKDKLENKRDKISFKLDDIDNDLYDVNDEYNETEENIEELDEEISILQCANLSIDKIFKNTSDEFIIPLSYDRGYEEFDCIVFDNDTNDTYYSIYFDTMSYHNLVELEEAEKEFHTKIQRTLNLLTKFSLKNKRKEKLNNLDK
jgi:DNA repair exonuclease SbcCD ATPase subunit